MPLFVEELTKTVLEAGLLADAGDRYELAGPLPPLAIPATLHDSLMARLDRLAPVKEVAQIGAVIGREFSYELLAAVAPLSAKPSCGDALDQLVASELVFRRGAPPEATYSFKHALVQDAAYAEPAQEPAPAAARPHRQGAGGALPGDRRDRARAARPALHRGGARRAGGRLLAAGRASRPLARSAMAEAVAHLSQGLELLAGVPDGAERRRRELDLQLALGAALIAAQGLRGAGGRARLRPGARAVPSSWATVAELFPALYGRLWSASRQRGETACGASRSPRSCCAGRRAAATPPCEVVAHRIVGVSAVPARRVRRGRDRTSSRRRALRSGRTGSSSLRLRARLAGAAACHWLGSLLVARLSDQALARSRRGARRRPRARPPIHAGASPCTVTALFHQLLRRRPTAGRSGGRR